MKYLKSFENKIIDNILDKINKSGMDSLTNLEQSYLKTPTKDLEKQLNGRTYTDDIGPYKATLKLYNIENTTEEFRGVKNYSRWNATLEMLVNNVNVKYDGYIMFKDDNYLSSHFESDDINHSSGELNTELEDLEGLQYEADSFFENALYSVLNESLLLEGRIEDIETKYSDKIDKNILNFFRDNDPTGNKSYFEWMCDRYSKITEEEKKSFKSDIPVTIVKMIIKYNRIKTKIKEKQINRIKSVQELGKVLNQEMNIDFLKELEEKKEAIIIYDSYEWIIYTPLSEAASELGDRTWCTVYDSKEHFLKHFGNYGALTYFINKLNVDKNFAIEQTIDGKADMWDHQDYKILEDEPIEEIDQLLGEIEYLRFKDREEFDWETIISKIPKAPVTERKYKKFVKDKLKSKGLEWLKNKYNLDIFYFIKDNGWIDMEFLSKFWEMIRKDPKKYIKDTNLFFEILNNINFFGNKPKTLRGVTNMDKNLFIDSVSQYLKKTNFETFPIKDIEEYIYWDKLINFILSDMNEKEYFSFWNQYDRW